MERKTHVHAEAGQQNIIITRTFDLPVESLFEAHTDPGIVAQWMNTHVLKLENKQHGGWQYETRDPQGNVVFRAHGTIHTFTPNQRIVRTFEMENAPFGAQLEFMDFEKLTESTSQLNIRIVFRSTDVRDQMMKLPFAHGLGMAHDRLEEVVKMSKKVMK
ncbi:MAG: SRPBCC domain-containing protein [Flavobacteriales bacterium]|nr:SRPBCC domain-containing protein [Flavobacteriales bacterium]MCB9448004.1 SRPBCC domain-containing protein [Flavobacteriales bacterium]